jgi:hypothetical protein
VSKVACFFTAQSASSQSCFAFGLYLVALALVLLLVPNTLLALLALPPTQDPWIRVVGMLLLALSNFYFLAARENWTPFFKVSVQVRSLLIVFLGGFVALGMLTPQVLVIGALDLVGAAWTFLALKKEGAFT